MHRPRTYRSQLLMNTDWRASDLVQEFKQSPLSKSVDRSYKLQFSRTINAIPGLLLFEVRVSGDHIQDTTPSGNHSSESSLYVQKILLNAFSDIVLTQQLRSIGDHARLRWNSSFSSNHQMVHWTHPPANNICQFSVTIYLLGHSTLFLACFSSNSVWVAIKFEILHSPDIIQTMVPYRCRRIHWMRQVTLIKLGDSNESVIERASSGRKKHILNPSNSTLNECTSQDPPLTPGKLTFSPWR